MEISYREAANREAQTGALIRLRGLYPSLKTALQKVADAILRRPEMVIYASVNEVAAAAAVSEATVMRFCRTLGFKGFQDFKIALAREMVTPLPPLQEGLSPGDDPATVVRKVFQAHLGALQDTQEVLEVEAVAAAAQLFLNARQIIIVGAEGCGPLVEYTANRFLPLGLPVRGYHDAFLMRAAAALLEAGDAALVICHSGSAREAVETARLAAERGARVIAITNNSLAPLTRVSEVVLTTASRDLAVFREGMATFLGPSTIIDCLYTLIFQVRQEESQKNLARIEAIKKL